MAAHKETAQEFPIILLEYATNPATCCGYTDQQLLDSIELTIQYISKGWLNVYQAFLFASPILTKSMSEANTIKQLDYIIQGAAMGLLSMEDSIVADTFPASVMDTIRALYPEDITDQGNLIIHAAEIKSVLQSLTALLLARLSVSKRVTMRRKITMVAPELLG